MRILGIESSCDETSASVVVDGREVLSNIIATQIPVHAKYGGVVPELASRNHVVDIIPVVEQALAEAECGWGDLDAIAVTQGPGLVGALLIGIETAKALAYSHDLPLLGVNHIEAHLMASTVCPAEGFERPEFPFIGLAVSGGHTSLVRFDGVGQHRLLGQTLDDAAGEALDKVGKMLGLGYPGGVKIDHLSEGGDPQALTFPRALPRRADFRFSFSGLKTSVRTYLGRLDAIPEGQALRDLCASVQEAVVDVLIRKTRLAAAAEGVQHIVLSGGVSANRRLRARMAQVAKENNLILSIPPRKLCTDNAAMIAGLAFHYLTDDHLRNRFDAFDLNARASWPVGV